jgi:hypothetical protein
MAAGIDMATTKRRKAALAGTDPPRPPCQATERCYELAANALLHLPSDTSWRLVHGTVRGADGNGVEHAWLLVDDEVFDPAVGGFMSAAKHRASYRAVARVTYSQVEALTEILRAGHFGPWMA